jgi:hypothetical protein
MKKLINNKVTTVISTRNRTTTTLPICLQSILSSTTLPRKLILIDDNDEQITNHNIIKYLLTSLSLYGIVIVLAKGKRSIIHNRQLELDLTDESDEFIYRIDDDQALNYDTLHLLSTTLSDDSDLAAVAGLVLNPLNVRKVPLVASNKIEDIFLDLNLQWFVDHPDEIITNNVDHLYSSFIYRRQRVIAIGGYDTNLSQHAEREETILTFKLSRSNKIAINTNAITNHYQINSPYTLNELKTKEINTKNNNTYFENWLLTNYNKKIIKEAKFLNITTNQDKNIFTKFQYNYLLKEHTKNNTRLYVILENDNPDTLSHLNNNYIQIIDPDSLLILSQIGKPL